MNPEQIAADNTQDPEFSVTFRNGALARIRKVAADLGIHEDSLEEVLKKGIVLMDLAKEGNYVTIKKGKDEYLIDLRTL